jgi:hypothetical protein
VAFRKSRRFKRCIDSSLRIQAISLHRTE